MATMSRNVSFMFNRSIYSIYVRLRSDLCAYTPASIFLLVGLEVLALFRSICRYYFGIVLIF